MLWHGRKIELSAKQRAALETAVKHPIAKGVASDAYTISGLTRRGWLYREDNGVYIITDTGRLALQSDEAR